MPTQTSPRSLFWQHYSFHSKTVLSIDISSVAVKMIVLSKQGLDYCVEDFAIEPFPEGLLLSNHSTNLQIIADTIKLALAQLHSKHKSACVAILSSAAITKPMSLAITLTANEIEEHILSTALDYMPYSLNEINFDFEVLSPNPNTPMLTDILFVASKRENIDDRVEVLTQAGLKTILVDVEAFTMEDACLLLGEFSTQLLPKQTVAIADIGSTITTFTVLDNGQFLYTHEQEFGGQYLIDEHQKRLGISYTKAYQQRYQVDVDADYNSDKVLMQFKETMLQQIKRSIQFFMSSNTPQPIDSLVLAGGCASIAGIDQLITEALSIPVFVANPFVNMRLSPTLNTPQLMHLAPAMMVACGLAMRGFKI